MINRTEGKVYQLSTKGYERKNKQTKLQTYCITTQSGPSSKKNRLVARFGKFGTNELLMRKKSSRQLIVYRECSGKGGRYAPWWPEIENNITFRSSLLDSRSLDGPFVRQSKMPFEGTNDVFFCPLSFRYIKNVREWRTTTTGLSLSLLSLVVILTPSLPVQVTNGMLNAAVLVWTHRHHEPSESPSRAKQEREREREKTACIEVCLPAEHTSFTFWPPRRWERK